MKRLRGTGVSKGYVKGPAFYHQSQDIIIAKKLVEDAAAELERFQKAKEKAEEQLEQLYQEALEMVGEKEAVIFKMHKMLLNDEEFSDTVCDYISSDKVSAEYGVWKSSEELQAMFGSMDNEYMKERAADIQDISGRLIRILTGAGKAATVMVGKGILLAEDLTPSETIRMDKEKVLGIVTEKGSSNSHSAILARTLGIPAIVGVAGLLAEPVAGELIIDGSEGSVMINPDQRTQEIYDRKIAADKAGRELLGRLKGSQAVTKDGCRVELACNIGDPGEAAGVLEYDGESIGLFRSEFLYMRSSDFPTEEEQFKAYRQVLEEMKGGRVIVRTLDLGADKHVPYLDLGEEANPALGYRAIRICLRQRQIFRTQLRALLRASAYGQLAIMFPMIAQLKELRDAKEYLAELKEELRKEGIAYSDSIAVGVMIETPAAVLISDMLAKEADFFSIGTNDLTQYTLAADRMNSRISDIYDPQDKAVLRMIKIAADHAHQAGKWVGICGESASDEELLGFYLAVGIDELSVSPRAVLPLKEKIQAINVKESREDELKKWLE